MAGSDSLATLQPPTAAEDDLLSLPDDILETILTHLDIQSIVDFSTVSSDARLWLATNHSVWRAAMRRAVKDPRVADVALDIALVHDPERAVRVAWKALHAKRECVRCRRQFSDGENSSVSCRHHPGTLISGAVLNGVGLTWTCCNERGHQRLSVLSDHDSNGCRHAAHDAPGSLSAVLEDVRAQGAPGAGSVTADLVAKHGGAAAVLALEEPGRQARDCRREHGADASSSAAAAATAAGRALPLWPSSAAVEWHPSGFTGAWVVTVADSKHMRW